MGVQLSSLSHPGMLTLVESMPADCYRGRASSLARGYRPLQEPRLAAGRVLHGRGRLAAWLVLLAGCLTHHRPGPIPDAEPGRIQFQSYCAGCHDYDGQRVAEAPPL